MTSTDPDLERSADPPPSARPGAVRPLYDLSMSKVRKTLTLDPDVVHAFGDDPSTLSATVNAILHTEMERRGRRAALASFVAELDAEFGEPDPDQVARFRNALS